MDIDLTDFLMNISNAIMKGERPEKYYKRLGQFVYQAYASENMGRIVKEIMEKNEKNI